MSKARMGKRITRLVRASPSNSCHTERVRMGDKVKTYGSESVFTKGCQTTTGKAYTGKESEQATGINLIKGLLYFNDIVVRLVSFGFVDIVVKL